MTSGEERALRVAVVGSGPAGMYATGHLLEGLGGTYLDGHLVDLVHRPVEVDVFDRLPTPWGLVRGGVAPDHPEKKLISKVFEEIAARPGFRFFGNIEIGRDVHPGELSEWYDAVIYAVGATSDRNLGIPGEALSGSISARAFVSWYNGHPDFSHLDFDLSGERAVIVGNGNVALDVARMLMLDADVLRRTDVADHALRALARSAIREVVILGRRDAAHAAFNNPELEELLHLQTADVVIDGDIAAPNRAPMPDSTDRATSRTLQTLNRLAGREQQARGKRIVFRFLATPVRVLGAERVEAVVVARNELERDSDGCVRSRRTTEESVIETGLVVRATGFLGESIPTLPFDAARGVIPHVEGRVVEDEKVVPGTYVTGWIKRGPSGMIGTNKKCARDTIRALLADAAAGRLPTASTRRADTVTDLLRQRKPDLVTFAGWKAIDRDERRAGQRAGRPRVKYVRVDQLLNRAGAIQLG